MKVTPYLEERQRANELEKELIQEMRRRTKADADLSELERALREIAIGWPDSDVGNRARAALERVGRA